MHSFTRYIGILFLETLLFLAGFMARSFVEKKEAGLLSPFVSLKKQPDLHLLQYNIANLQQQTFVGSPLQIETELAREERFITYLFSYQTLGKKMTGQLNVPLSLSGKSQTDQKAIVLLRGYVPPEAYATGVGTKNAAAAFANQGYITVAPDFFGYGGSDPEPEDTWQARFEKPIVVAELIDSIEKHGVPTATQSAVQNTPISAIGIWAHSNGGQIALTTLQVLQRSIPTTLWAPVTAPFPYSILYFSDEYEDEGKQTRKWIAEFEENYDIFLFSLTRYLESLKGPIQIQHGTNDDAALVYWSQEFVAKVENLENPPEMELIIHPNADHNMVPRWNAAIQNDTAFFAQYLKSPAL